jgi:hypothetical protein
MTLYFKHKRYWGVSDLDTIDNTYILTNFNSELADNQVKTISVTPNNQYVYYVYPNTWGQSSFTINNIPDNNTF